MSEPVPNQSPEGPASAPGWWTAWLPQPPAVMIRALVRLTVFVALTFLLWFLVGLMVVPLGNLLLASVLSLGLAVFTVTALMMRIYEMRPVYYVGLFVNRTAAGHLGVGLAMGLAASQLIVGIQWVSGWIHFAPAPVEGSRLSAAAFGFVVLALGAAGEELLFHGYGFQQLLYAFGPWFTIVTTSILFASAHTANPAASPLGVVNTGLFGLVFGYAFWRTRDLWLPLGMHFSWNFSLACIGSNVSGLKIRLMGASVEASGPTVWTGGDYGPEGSALTVLVLILVLLLLWKLPLGRQPQGLVVSEPGSSS